MTRFWGKLLLINFALGVATGIVQEFQLGMAWSEYSRFVGDIFGAPLAIEGRVAFFLESTFLGLWIFGWDRLPRRVHLATVFIGTSLSAYFILAYLKPWDDLDDQARRWDLEIVLDTFESLAADGARYSPTMATATVA